MGSTITPSLDKLAALAGIGEDEFETEHLPERMGNTAAIAYGGFALATAIRAACTTVAGSYRLYSALGNYLGPALCDRKLRARVRRLRDTKTFATRFVEVQQVMDDGVHRSVMTMLADFHTPEPASVLTYSAPPSRAVGNWQEGLTDDEFYGALESRGVHKPLIEFHRSQFGLIGRFLERRQCKGSVFTQNMYGFAKLPTTQDHLPLTSRSSEDWNRSNVPLPAHADNVVAMGFMSDSAVAFLPLSHSGLSLMDAGACSSLDFALRFFVNNVDYAGWHLRQLKTHTGGEGRTYSEARFWDEAGTLVCSMTQQSILRPKPESKEKSKSKM